MRHTTASTHGHTPDRLSRVLGAALTFIPVVGVMVLVLLPLGAVLWRATGRVVVDDDGATLGAGDLIPAVGRTLVATGLIGVLAVLLALPAGWLLRRSSRLLGAFVLVPLLLPNYLAYAGWTLLRAPRTYLGDRIGDAPAWVSKWVGWGIGVWGMAFWAWPLAAIVLASAARRIDPSLLDAMDLDVPSRWRRLAMLTRFMAPGIVAAVLLVMLVMMGSMVPLDVSRLDTYSIELLRWLNRHPSDIPVWRASWPVLIIAILGALLVMRRSDDGGGPGDGAAPALARRGEAGLLGSAMLVWGLSVIVPGVLFLMSLREPPHAATLRTIGRFLWAFWRDSGGAVVSSASVAVRVGVIALVMSGCAWYGASRERTGRRLMAVCCVLFLVVGLLPGVLVGTAVRRGADMVDPAMADSSWLVVGAHLARFAFVGVLVALWLAGRESREERGLRSIDGATTPRGFAHACLARHWSVLVGGALATAILSFHEIEATVMIWPPGTRNLAQEMLDALHFSRDERLGAAAVNLLGVGVGVAYLAGWLMMGGRAFQSRQPASSPRSIDTRSG